MAQPPKYPLKLLRWLIRKDYMEELEGDLREEFEDHLAVHGIKKAERLYWREAIKLIRPALLRHSKWSEKLKNIGMLQHNLVLTIRNFRKHKSQFLINLTGLSAGLACTLFIYLWVSDELGKDKFHKNDEQLYQVLSNHTDASGIFTWRGVPGLLLDKIQAQVPEVKSAVATTDTHEYTLSVGDTFHKAQGKFADVDFFRVFSYSLIAGQKEEVLNDMSGIVISENLAMRLFNNLDVIGKQIEWHFWGKTKTLQITGIMEDVPQSSSDQFDFLLNWDYYHDVLIDFKNWGNYYGRIMLVLQEGSGMTAVDKKLTDILQEKQQGERVTLMLYPYTDLYLNSKFENGMAAGGRIENVRLFSIIGLFIVLISCINFINLSTARASLRSREVGIKKTLGASRSSLIAQYFTESVVMSVFAAVIALSLVALLLPNFNILAQKQIVFSFDADLVLSIGCMILIVGLLAGCYPALYLSRFDPVSVLKGKLATGRGELFGRKTLVVLQFALSIILILGVLVVYQQMEYVKEMNLGYDRDNLIYFEREGRLIDNTDAMLEALRNTPGITKAASSGFMVGGGNSTGGVSWEGKTPDDQIQFWETRGSHGMIDILGLELIAGRPFSKAYGVDSAGIIFNETAIAAMGLTDPIGKKVRHYSGEKTIIGVVRDFNLNSLHTAIEPALFLYNPEESHFLMVKLEAGNEVETLERIERLYTKFNPGYVFDPRFIDQDYQALYDAESRISVLSRYFAGLAILISCLGLFGLASFTAETRYKEIGIRKILGSGIGSIVFMLTGSFIKMVLIAIAIALPFSFIIASGWLDDFAYSIELEWWYFAVSAIAALSIAWITVALQTYRAASINPAQCLRDE